MVRRAAVAVALAGLMVPLGLAATSTAAHADSTTPLASSVGGGASGIGLYVQANAPKLLETLTQSNTYGVYAYEPESVVTLPSSGSATPIVAQAAGETEDGVTVDAVKVSTVGNLYGDPFAASSTELTGVHIPGTDIEALSTSCVWNAAGATATTSILYDNGSVYTPPPGTIEQLPDGEVLALNDQTTGYYYDGTSVAHVITVIGAELSLETPQVSPGRGPQGYVDLYLGFTSCDPLNLPSLAGLGALLND